MSCAPAIAIPKSLPPWLSNRFHKAGRAPARAAGTGKGAEVKRPKGGKGNDSLLPPFTPFPRRSFSSTKNFEACLARQENHLPYFGPRWLFALLAIAFCLHAAPALQSADNNSSTRKLRSQPKAEVPAVKTNSVETLAALARPSVVVISHYGREGAVDGVGTGFVVSEDGLIATCLHVIGEARPIRVQFADGRHYEATAGHEIGRA